MYPYSDLSTGRLHTHLGPGISQTIRYGEARRDSTAQLLPFVVRLDSEPCNIPYLKFAGHVCGGGRQKYTSAPRKNVVSGL